MFRPNRNWSWNPSVETQLALNRGARKCSPCRRRPRKTKTGSKAVAGLWP
jgi:hypothetical protein